MIIRKDRVHGREGSSACCAYSTTFLIHVSPLSLCWHLLSFDVRGRLLPEHNQTLLSLSLSFSLSVFSLLMFTGAPFRLASMKDWQCPNLIPLLAMVFLVGGWLYFHSTRLGGRAVGMFDGTITSSGCRPKVEGKQDGLNVKITNTLRVPGFLDLKQPNFVSRKRIPSPSFLWWKYVEATWFHWWWNYWCVDWFFSSIE